MDLGTPNSAQFVELSIVRLVLSRHMSIADEAGFREGRGLERLSEALFSLLVHSRLLSATDRLKTFLTFLC
jgi:hypothetical protein